MSHRVSAEKHIRPFSAKNNFYCKINILLNPLVSKIILHIVVELEEELSREAHEKNMETQVKKLLKKQLKEEKKKLESLRRQRNVLLNDKVLSNFLLK